MRGIFALKSTLRNENDESRLYGQIFTKFGPYSLADRLSKSGLRARVGESSHYEGGEYVRIDADDEVDFRLERIASGEYLVHASPGSVEQMIRVTSLVSGTLTALDIRHRFEIYDAGSQMTHYFHHLWPPGDPARLRSF